MVMIIDIVRLFFLGGKKNRINFERKLKNEIKKKFTLLPLVHQKNKDARGCEDPLD